MSDWHPYGNPNAQGDAGRKSSARAQAMRSDSSRTLSYSYSHEEKDVGEKHPRLYVYAHHGDTQVGKAEFHRKGAGLYATENYVEPEHRRRGVATAMYQHAAKVSGRSIIPSRDQTALGKLFSQGIRKKGVY